MLNQVVLVGRIIEINEKDMVLKVQRIEKDDNGEYIYDTIYCSIGERIYENVKEHCEVGSIVGVKGSLFSIDDKLGVKTDKITFLASRKSDSGNEE